MRNSKIQNSKFKRPKWSMSLHLVVGGQKFKNSKFKIQKTAWIHDIPSNLGVRNSKIRKNPIVYDSRYGFWGSGIQKSKIQNSKDGMDRWYAIKSGSQEFNNSKFKNPKVHADASSGFRIKRGAYYGHMLISGKVSFPEGGGIMDTGISARAPGSAKEYNNIPGASRRIFYRISFVFCKKRP